MRLPELTGFLRRVRAQDQASGRVVPGWAPALFVVCTIVLIPWTVLLAMELPDRQVARHWDVAWAGLDVGIAGGLLATAITVMAARCGRRWPRRSPGRCCSSTRGSTS